MVTESHRVLTFPQPRANPAGYNGDEALLGHSQAIGRTWSQIRRVAPHFRAAIVTGEGGCGAEAAARSLHALSPVSQLPFVVIAPEEAEALLGSAIAAPISLCDGVIFVPDVDRFSVAAQRGLLRKLRLRGRYPIRIVAATSASLRACVSAGRFSAELAEILGTVTIAIPPLRERRDDLPLLATRIVNRLAERLGVATPVLSPGFLDAVCEFSWPGNLGQMEQVFSSLLEASEDVTLTVEHFAAANKNMPEHPAVAPVAVRMVRLEEIVQEHIRAVLIGCHGNKLRAAEILGISRSTLYRMLDGAAANQPFTMAG
jgi:DNA-binding NtrC family response regulator